MEYQIDEHFRLISNCVIKAQKEEFEKINEKRRK